MTYVGYKTANNVISYLTSTISGNSTNIIVNDGGIFPDSFPYLLTIEQQADGQTIIREIVKATAKIGNTITIQRAVESCILNDTVNPKTFTQTPHSFEAGSVVSLSMTAGTLQDVQDGITDNANAITEADDNIDTLIGLIETLEEDIANL